MISIVAFYAFYSCSLPLSKYLLTYTSPIFLVAARMLAAGIILLFGTLYIKKERIVLKSHHLLWVFNSIFFGVFLKYALRNWSLQHMPVAKLAFMMNCTPFVAALFSYIWFKERLSFKQWIGLLVGFIGIIPLVILKTKPEAHLSEILYISWPELALFASLVCHTYGMILARQLIKFEKYSPSVINCMWTLGGGLFALFTAWMFEGFFPVTNVTHFFPAFAALVIISNVICHTLYLQLTQHYTVTFISFTEFMSPFFVLLYSCLFLGETASWIYPLSGIIVFCGLYIFHKDELKRSA